MIHQSFNMPSAICGVYVCLYARFPPAASTKMFGSIHGTQEWIGICYKFTINDKLVIQYALR